MSSTNRSNARYLHEYDYYVTPVKDIKIFLEAFDKVENIDWNNIHIVDPAAGGNESFTYELDNNTIKTIEEHCMSYPVAIEELFGKCNINTFDIRENSFAEHKVDYFNTKLDYQPDMIITNPPFKQGITMINKALNDVKDNGFVIMLLRLNFFGSDSRFDFFKENMPKYCFVHHKRISFTDDKKTDSIEYCHMVWQKGYKTDRTQLFVI